MDWDLFISHATEDKDSFVRPLATTLTDLGVKVWYDEFTLKIGDSLSRSIDRGLANSQFGLVVVSPTFIQKRWPEYELRGLVSREIHEDKVILPVWLRVTYEEVKAFSPSLADKVAVDTSRSDLQHVVRQIVRVVRPDIYDKLAKGYAAITKLEQQAMEELRANIAAMAEEIDGLHEELADFRCPYCKAPLTERIHAPVDEEQKDWDLREMFECGYISFGSFLERPCPMDPRFPAFEEYELLLQENPRESVWKWHCFAKATTDMARKVFLSPTLGQTKDDATAKMKSQYDSCIRRRNVAHE